MEQQSYFLIIPAPIFNDENLSDKEKLLIGLINSLLNEEGYCFAGNEYLANKMKTTTQNISRLLGNLNKKGHIEFKYIRNGTVIKNRKIYPTLPLTKMLIAINENDNGTVNKNVKESNKDISNIYIKKKYIKKKKKVEDLKIYEERFEEFWENYPKKRNKAKCKEWYLKNKPNEEEHGQILLAIVFASSEDNWKKDNYQYAPHPSTFLNQKRWEDFKDE